MKIQEKKIFLFGGGGIFGVWGGSGGGVGLGDQGGCDRRIEVFGKTHQKNGGSGEGLVGGGGVGIVRGSGWM